MSSLWLLPAYAIYKYNITEVIIVKFDTELCDFTLSSVFSQLDLTEKPNVLSKEINRDIRSGDFWRETAEDHTTRGDVAHLNLKGHKACHPPGKRPVKYKT